MANEWQYPRRDPRSAPAKQPFCQAWLKGQGCNVRACPFYHKREADDKNACPFASQGQPCPQDCKWYHAGGCNRQIALSTASASSVSPNLEQVVCKILDGVPQDRRGDVAHQLGEQMRTWDTSGYPELAEGILPAIRVCETDGM